MKTTILTIMLAVTAVAGFVAAANAGPFKPACSPTHIVMGRCVQY